MDSVEGRCGSGIVGVSLHERAQIVDQRGAVLHMLRRDSDIFTEFGEIYFSEVPPGIVKAWKRHREMTQHIVVPVGRIRIVLYDDRSQSPSQGKSDIHEMGRPDRFLLLRIPPGIWYGFQGISTGLSLIANCTDIPHDPQEVDRLPEDTESIPYRWRQI